MTVLLKAETIWQGNYCCCGQKQKIMSGWHTHTHTNTHCEVIFTGPQTSSRRQHICKSLSSIPSMDFTTSCHQTLLLLLFSSHSPFFPSIEELACGFYRIHINLLTRPPESQGWKSTTHVWQKEWSNTHIRKKQKQKPKRVKAGRSIRKLHKKKERRKLTFALPFKTVNTFI